LWAVVYRQDLVQRVVDDLATAGQVVLMIRNPDRARAPLVQVTAAGQLTLKPWCVDRTRIVPSCSTMRPSTPTISMQPDAFSGHLLPF
jgi:hypothetical protein